jgi:adenosylmethionine-8-amino-7-oxononanoate aminotransferase
VREVGPYFQERLRSLRDLPLVADVRGTGLMAAVEMSLGTDARGQARLEEDYLLGNLVDSYCHEYGLLVRPLINVCIMSPPLIITREQVDDLVDALRRALLRAQTELLPDC